jgi:proline iminopeptidase
MNKANIESTVFNSGYLKVSDLHQIYFEESGNSKGIPLVRLHGGPGNYFKEKHRLAYDQNKFRVILFDQRGCGKSIPVGEIRENTTNDLVEDIEKLRGFLKIEKWIVHGGSWGSALALLYAEKYPEQILHLVLNGIFLARKQEIDWVFEGGPRMFYPDLWNLFNKNVADLSGDGTLEKYIKFFESPLEQINIEKLKNWCAWEGALSRFDSRNEIIDWDDMQVVSDIYNEAKINLHYNKNRFFIGENQILENINNIQNISADIVHGRYDLDCPVKNAYELKNALPHAKLHIIQLAGHSSSEKPMIEKVREITDEIVYASTKLTDYFILCS